MYSTAMGGLAVILYLMTGSLLGIKLSRTAVGKTFHTSRLLMLGWGAVFLHGVILYFLVVQPEGMNLGFFNALSFTGWLSAVVLLLATLFWPVESLGILLLPYSALTVILALIFPSQRIVADYQSWPVEVHIFISILAYSMLALAALQAVLLAIQDRRLHNHHPGGFVRAIPPLITMEQLLFQMICIGFVLLSLGLISGVLFLEDVSLEDVSEQRMVHKTVLSFTAWLVFGILLWGRWRFGWRGQIAIRWTLGGFAALVLAYFGSKMVLELILQR
jgi:ABC-type uncharacterized transport system permease subunit